jgi:hypothetical protein
MTETVYVYNREGCVVGMKLPGPAYRNDAAKYRALTDKSRIEAIEKQKLSEGELNMWYRDCFIRIVETLSNGGFNILHSSAYAGLISSNEVIKGQQTDELTRNGFCVNSVIGGHYTISW